MEYRGIQYTVVQTANPTGFKWTAHLAAGRIRTGQSFAMKAATVDAERKIDRALKTISQKPRPRGENVLDLMNALKKSIASETSTKAKKPRKASAGQKEMLLPIEGKKPAKRAAKSERPTGRRKAG